MRALAHRVLGVAVIALFAVTELSRVAHEGEAHAVCPEHGEAIHAGVVHQSEGEPSFQSTSHAEDAHDDHCSVTSLRTGSDPRVSPLAGLVLLHAPAPRPAAREAHAPLALLDFAPKLAPPSLV